MVILWNYAQEKVLINIWAIDYHKLMTSECVIADLHTNIKSILFGLVQINSFFSNPTKKGQERLFL